MEIAAVATGLALMAARAAPADISKLRTVDNPRPLANGHVAPSRHPAWGAGQGVAGSGHGAYGVLKDDFLCNDDTTGGCQQLSPRIGVDSAGDFVVSWYEFREGDADAWFQRLDSAGNKIGNNERLNTDITMGWQGEPASAMGPDGRALFSWEDRRDIGNSDLFAQRFDAAGNRLGDNFRMSDSAAAGDQDASGAWIAPNGVALVAWDDRRNSLTGDIYAQFLNPDGSPKDTNFRVNDDPINYANQYEPRVSGDSSGRFVVAWMDGRGTGANDWNIFCQRFNAQGQPLGSNIQVTTDTCTQWNPDVSCGLSGAFVVTWDDARNGNWDVYAQRYDANGNPLGQNFKVNDDNSSTDQLASGVAVNRYGEFMVVWNDGRSGENDAYARRYDAAGNPLGPSFKLNDVSTGSQADPSIGARPDGGYWTAWSDARSGDPDIYCQRLARDGSKVGANFRINDDHGSAQQRCSSIGTDLHGRICIDWEDERNGACDIYRCVTDSSGNVIGANLRLNDDKPGAADHYYAGVAAGNGRFLAAWTDMRAGPDSTDIYAQYMDGSGTPVGSNFCVNSDATGADQWYPYPAMDSSNNAAILWMDSRDQSGSVYYRLYCRRYGAGGNPLGPEFVVQDTMADGEYGSLAMNRQGRFVAAWMDSRDTATGTDAYCQAYRSDGTPIGRNIRVNTDVGNTYQGYPACAIDEQGRFVVAWEDTRNGHYDVYLQWFDSTGARLGENERVNDNSTQTDAYSPSCAFAPDGRLAVEFNDERDYPGCPQIYCQRFRPDRTRISDNQVLNDPRLFPHNYHWTVGQSVSASDSALAFTWTDNRRHKGFDIYAKLTDWNLVGVSDKLTAGTRVSGRPTIVGRHGRLEVDLRSRTGVASLYDACGRQVRRASSPGRCELDLNGVSPGAYFLLTSDGAELRCRKIVIE